MKVKKIYGDKGTLSCDVWKYDFTPVGDGKIVKPSAIVSSWYSKLKIKNCFIYPFTGARKYSQLRNTSSLSRVFLFVSFHSHE
ncbi:hypothetical protein [Hanamia caeni]|uniref:hypothetical protein n=1 Tax=Hanamia caeni TaxID=2294116 RepID=UPI0011CDF669|nr:hypothetical protein [Hanamia caeni]